MKVGFGSYGRIGVSWTNGQSGIDGRRLNLINMGSIGGRFEEQDYLELGMAFQMMLVSLQYDSKEALIYTWQTIFILTIIRDKDLV